jgi:hypothetical protein
MRSRQLETLGEPQTSLLLRVSDEEAPQSTVAEPPTAAQPTDSMSADAFQTKSMKRKNIRNLALKAPPRSVTPSAGDAQIPGAIGNNNSERGDTLEIGVEFRLDLRSEDLIVLKDLGSGNGGTVSKVQHAATKVIMARKVSAGARGMMYDGIGGMLMGDRSYTSKPRRRCESE